MAGRFEGETVMITGASTGIGRAISGSFAQEGANAYLVGRRADLLESAANEIRSRNGSEPRVITADVSSAEDVARVVDVLRTEVGHLDILVNAEGVLRVGAVHETSEEDFDAMFCTNVKGLWMISKAMVPLMKDRPNSNMIHLSSTAGTLFETGLGVYEAAKSAVNTLTRVMAKELAEFRIRVNAIAPGPIDTELYHGSVFGDDLEERISKCKEGAPSLPFGRLGTPGEVARLAMFLASKESDFISGSITTIDGAMGY